MRAPTSLVGWVGILYDFFFVVTRYIQKQFQKRHHTEAYNEERCQYVEKRLFEGENREVIMWIHGTGAMIRVALSVIIVGNFAQWVKSIPRYA